MYNMIKYAKEYRKVDFLEKPFCAADSLILSQVSYYNYGGSFFEKCIFKMTLQEFFKDSTEEILKGVYTAEKDKELIRVLINGGRHGSLRACSYMEIADRQIGEQFAAITFEIRKGIYYIAFRGTDNSVTGWKEDMCLSYQSVIPAQKTAVQYAKDVMHKFSGQFYLGGHSKGGNLAVYSAMYLPKNMQKRLIAVFNHDGPGFLNEIYECEQYQVIRPLIQKTLPQSSVVGMLLEKDDAYQVVYSVARALQQHDIYTWSIVEGEFVILQETDKFSHYINLILERWLEEIDFEKRKQIVDLIFDTIYDMGISWFYELTEEKAQKFRMLIESISETEDNDRKLVWSSLKSLIKISADELQEAVEEQKNIKKEEIIILKDTLIETIDFWKRKFDNLNSDNI